MRMKSSVCQPAMKGAKRERRRAAARTSADEPRFSGMPRHGSCLGLAGPPGPSESRGQKIPSWCQPDSGARANGSLGLRKGFDVAAGVIRRDSRTEPPPFHCFAIGRRSRTAQQIGGSGRFSPALKGRIAAGDLMTSGDGLRYAAAGSRCRAGRGVRKSKLAVQDSWFGILILCSSGGQLV